MEADLRNRLGRHGVSALAACFAVGALVEDLVNPSVMIDGRSYDRAPEATVVVVLVGVAVLLALRGRLGVAAPLSVLALFGFASLSAPAWVLDSTFVYLLVMLASGLAGYMAQSRLDHAGLL